ncbi:MAG: von Willebrand factor type A domain-containing protein [Crocinitomicaceae bacterium]|nr:von Willebrand factor type A domain-containing protein [Crocinitomicaceae bacterium]
MKTVLLIATMSLMTWISAQGEIRGKVTDKDTGEEILGASVLLVHHDSTIQGCVTDFNGKFRFSNLPAGTYDLEFRFVAYEPHKITNVIVNESSVIIIDHEFESAKMLECVEVVNYSVRKIKSADIKMAANKSLPSYKVASKSKGTIKKNYIGGGNANISKTNRNKYSEFTENEFVKVASEALSTFSIDVDNASYSIIRKQINSGTRPPEQAVRIEEMINYFKYDYASPKNDEAFAVHTEIGNSPWSANKIVKIGLKGKTFENEKAPRNNLVFLLDVSGSMGSEDKLGYVQKSMKMLVKSLSGNDKVAIVTYAGYTATPLKPTSCDQIDKIFEAIDGLTSGGSTNGEGGINQAYDLAEKHFMKDGNNRIILCTDGDFNVGVSSNGGLEKLIEKKRKTGVFLTVCGFGMGNLQDQYMETLADKGNGNYYYIDNLLEAKKVFQEDFTSTIHTIAKDVKIQVEFNPSHVKSYRLIGYDNRMLKKEDFLDDTKDAGELGAGHTVTAIYEVELKKDEDEFNNGLKYQNSSIKEGFENELLTIKLRYKKPDENTSQEFEVPVIYDPKEELSEDFKFVLAVAEFGLILRKSKFKGNSNIDEAIELAKAGKGKDENGYRAEFIRLMEMYELNLAEK